jgi:subtilisin family serine protease
VTERPQQVVEPGYMQLSGTSFAAPVVAGTAADLLAEHPGWTPDQVKGALMVSAGPTSATGRALGVGAVDASAATAAATPPNPNAALDKFVTADPLGGPTPVFDAESWGSAVQGNASWGSESWGSESWGSAYWNAESWGSSYWSSAVWSSASAGSESWGSESWGSESWGSESWGSNAATDDYLPTGGYWVDPPGGR